MQIKQNQIEWIGKMKKFKKGIAMIELIFAIVIIGIVLLSTPILIQQSVNSGYVALQQEAIAAISTQTTILLSKHWDEGDANNTSGVAPIIKLVNEKPNSPFKLGGIIDINLSSRTSSIGSISLTALPIGTDWNETTPDAYDDVDDYNNQTLDLTIFNGELSTTDIGEYIDQNITISTTVTFADDRPPILNDFNNSIINIGNNIFLNQNIYPYQSNIKFIKTHLTTTNTDIPELNKSIILNAFSCNLGTYSLGGRQY
jgi:type II secretory pathway pseudopilin PulG